MQLWTFVALTKVLEARELLKAVEELELSKAMVAEEVEVVVLVFAVMLPLDNYFSYCMTRENNLGYQWH